MEYGASLGMGHIRKFIINFKFTLTWRSYRSNILLFARGNNLGVPNRSLKLINHIKQICFHFLSGRFKSRADNRHVLELLREFLDLSIIISRVFISTETVHKYFPQFSTPWNCSVNIYLHLPLEKWSHQTVYVTSFLRFRLDDPQTEPNSQTWFPTQTTIQVLTCYTGLHIKCTLTLH